MIEKYINDTIATERLAIEERMKNANLIDKYLANKSGAEIRAPRAQTTPDAPEPLQNPDDVPTDVPDTPVLPSGNGATTSRGEDKNKK
jgi:hypothetical protein